ncbi:hypothetical protein V6R21_17795 [Limibacter armeniacum]|uniref:hypothetical protein n=1 Tax=Limibacter armeniacum TaxID=466084 RepID=UPI002FE67E06
MTEPQIQTIYTGVKLEIPLRKHLVTLKKVYGKSNMGDVLKYLLKQDLVKNKDQPFAQKNFKEALESGLLGYDVLDPATAESSSYPHINEVDASSTEPCTVPDCS